MLLESRWGTDTIRFVARSESGSTLILFDTTDDRGKVARDGAGWHVCLDSLEHDLNGTNLPTFRAF